MSWEDILKGRSVDIDLDELFEKYSSKKKEIDEWYEKEFMKLKQRMMRAETGGAASIRNLRRKHPVTHRKKGPVDIEPEQREKHLEMPDPKTIEEEEQLSSRFGRD